MSEKKDLCKDTQVTQKSEMLFEQRKNISSSVIVKVEDYINTLANIPKEFDKSVEELKVSYEKFENEIKLAQEAYEAAKVSGSVAGGGVAVGVGVATLAPSAAIAIATTFGTASTGAAISALSGAAATNAALAWLGGGAIAVGGGGMAGGNALLALAGPVGWGIAGASIIGGGFYMRSKNKEIADKANQESINIENYTHTLNASLIEIIKMIDEIKSHSLGVKNQLEYLNDNAPKSYTQFSDTDKHMIMSLKNNIESLSKLLVKNISR